MAKYQHASDAIEGMPPFSGVIRDDGKWVANMAANPDWQEYLEWAKDPKNHPDPYKSPANGGVAIKLEEGQLPYGAMVDSMPPEPTTGSAAQAPAPPPPPAAPAPTKK